MSRTAPASKIDFDPLLLEIADYVTQATLTSPEAFSTARYCLMDALGCAILALQYPACTNLLGPVFSNTAPPQGSRIPGTSFILDPIQAAFNIGALIRWLDFNDTWLAAEWAHPSDNLGAILAVSDYQSQLKLKAQQKPLRMRNILEAMIKAYEIQGILALENSFNRLGFDHVFLVKLASSAVSSYLLDGNKDLILKTLTQVFVDGLSLRTYRHAPNTGSRKSWAAGDACSRAVWLAWLTHQGEMGYPKVLSTKTWGFNDTILRGAHLTIARPLQSYVMENILFKVSYPAEFHAQTAVECAIQLHSTLPKEIDTIDRIEIETQEAAQRIINKAGPLHNPADRDHCLQYMVAVSLLHGDLKAEFYENEFSEDPRIDRLRQKMKVVENKSFSKDYLHPDKRSIGNAIQIFYKDGQKSEKISVEYPIGHKKRRSDAIPLLFQKFRSNLKHRFREDQIEEIIRIFKDQDQLEEMAVNEFMELFVLER